MNQTAKPPEFLINTNGESFCRNRQVTVQLFLSGFGSDNGELGTACEDECNHDVASGHHRRLSETNLLTMHETEESEQSSREGEG